MGVEVNPEIWSKVRPATRSRDLMLQKVQNTILKAIVPISEFTDRLKAMSLTL